MVHSMGYRVYVGARDVAGDKIYVAKENDSSDFTMEELVDFLQDRLSFLPARVRERHWHLTVEKDGLVVKNPKLDYYLEMYNKTQEEIDKENRDGIFYALTICLDVVTDYGDRNTYYVFRTIDEAFAKAKSVMGREGLDKSIYKDLAKNLDAEYGDCGFFCIEEYHLGECINPDES